MMLAQQLDDKAEYVPMKFIMIGDSGSGKTSLFNRLSRNHFLETSVSTLGVEFALVWIVVEGIQFKIYLWDTAGQERYRDLADAYYRNAHCFLVVYDMTQPRSMKDIGVWMRRIRKNIGDSILSTPKVMIGNKLDLNEGSRSNIDPDIIAAAGPKSLRYIDVSAKTGENLDELKTILGEIAMETHRARYPESFK